MCKFSIFFTLIAAIGYSQTIQFNDPDLLYYLKTVNCVDVDGDGNFDSTADFNNDGEIQVSEALQIEYFSFYSAPASNIEDLSGFEHFSNIKLLNVSNLGVDHFDFSILPSLESLRLSSSIDSFLFDNPVLKQLQIQNVGFNNPLFDLTNLPALEYVRIQPNSLTDNLIFGSHPNLEELRILSGDYSTLNLTGMPALKYLTIDKFTGSSLDVSNCIALEEFLMDYTVNLNEITGIGNSANLNRINFSQDNAHIESSDLELVFNNQSLTDVEIRGAKTFSLSNNLTEIGGIRLYYVSTIDINNSSFGYVNSSLNNAMWIEGTLLEQINLSYLDNLRLLRFDYFSTDLPLDLSSVEVKQISFVNCSLTELNLKNGNAIEQFQSSFSTDIQFICVDSDEMDEVESGYANTDSPAVIHPYCTFVLGGEYYEITGNLLADLGNGCESITNGSLFDVQFTVTDGESTDIFYSDSLNNYSYTLPEGDHTLNSQLLNIDYWTVNPSGIDLNFPADGTPYIQDFCIVPAGTFNDLEIVIVPINDAQPGFETHYKLIYKNSGTTTLSGDINLGFNDNIMNFLTASPNISGQTTGNLIWNYTGLLPFETREISFSMLLNTPTDPDFPLNANDELIYTAIINPVVADETSNNNSFILNQVVVNSFDPNDIICLEGNAIALAEVGEYVHYRIRFENNGTANATNIVVKDVLDMTKFDVTSLVPLHSSHDFYTRIVNDNEVEFIFENIQLPFDETNNDGYVLFKIKTLPTLVLGDSFSNQAEIYFDYNFPIITNLETTIIEENLSVPEFGVNEVFIFPNPVSEFLTIKSENYITRISIYDSNGALMKIFKPELNVLEQKLDLKSLTAGIYYLEILSGNTKQVLKFIKK